MRDLIDYVEEVIEDGWPYTLVLAVLWMFIGWPVYLLRSVKKIGEPTEQNTQSS